MENKKRVLSGIQPTNEIHIGNYFGAVKNWVGLQAKYQCIYTVVDYHAMTVPFDPEKLRTNTKEMFISLLACGLDPDKSIIFIQSMVPEHTELTWILNCFTSFGEMNRMTQFKDKSVLLQEKSKDDFISTGLFNYPILQAADILIYNADFVPVGKDQEQHLELTRNIATRFNNHFNPYFNLPQPLFAEVPKLMSLADPSKKMSKSLGPKHFVGLFDDENVIRKKVKSAVTDIGMEENQELSPGVKNLFEILRACDKNELYRSFWSEYEKNTLKYSYLKEEVAVALIQLTNNIKERKRDIIADKDYIKKMMKEGSEKAREIAYKTIKEVRNICGLPKI